jgi:hypothetical protein
MQNPYDLPKNKYDILGYAEIDIRNNMIHDSKIINVNINKNPEVVLYYKDNNLKDIAIQGHPEYDWAPASFKNYSKTLLNKLFN